MCMSVVRINYSTFLFLHFECVSFLLYRVCECRKREHGVFFVALLDGVLLCLYSISLRKESALYIKGIEYACVSVLSDILITFRLSTFQSCFMIDVRTIFPRTMLLVV